MTDQIQTGPELYELGVRFLRLAREALPDWPNPSDYLEKPEEYRLALASRDSRIERSTAIAAAAFTGAQAAALGALAADEAESKELAQAWRDAIGDDPGPDVGDNPDSEAETTDGE